MAVGLYSGVSGLALGIGLYRNVSGLWGGASGLIDGFGGAGFSPASLFAAGEPGAWYDPSDFSTLFQDSAGTTPVTAVAQQVGLMLDKSQGLVLGPELVTNSWTRGFLSVDGTILVSGPSVTITQGAGDGSGFRWVQPITCVVGRSYRLSLSNATKVGGTLALAAISSNSSGTGITADNSINDGQVPGQKFVVATATTMYVVISLSGGSTGNSATFTGLSVKELPGNHAFQSNSGQRPTLGRNPTTGRLNLLTFTEQFDNAAWLTTGLNTTVTGNTATAPNATDTADTLRETTENGPHYIATATAYVTFVSGTNYTYSIYVKKGDGASSPNIVQLSLNGTYFGVLQYANYNISTGVVTSSTGGTATIESAGNGWYRISWTATATSGGTGNVSALLFCNNNPTSARLPSYIGSTTSNVFIWGAQLELGSTATAYQRVVSSFDVTEAGKPDLYYVNFDGTDDGMLTNTITPGINKAQVFTGVRKLSDAALGVLVETSVASSLNSGTLAMFAPDAALSASYRFGTKGDATQRVDSTSPANFSAPITNVLTGIGDIAGDVSTLRINGVQAATNAADQGAGNYLAYPLYLGRRGGTANPFNGNIYSMIVRFGANLTADQIAATEAWVNTKTAALPVDYYYLQTATGDQLVDGNGDELYSLPIFG